MIELFKCYKLYIFLSSYLIQLDESCWRRQLWKLAKSLVYFVSYFPLNFYGNKFHQGFVENFTEHLLEKRSGLKGGDWRRYLKNTKSFIISGPSVTTKILSHLTGVAKKSSLFRLLWTHYLVTWSKGEARMRVYFVLKFRGGTGM